MSIVSLRGLFYLLSWLLGGKTAVRRGAIGKQLLRRGAARGAVRLLGRLFR